MYRWIFVAAIAQRMWKGTKCNCTTIIYQYFVHSHTILPLIRSWWVIDAYVIPSTTPIVMHLQELIYNTQDIWLTEHKVGKEEQRDQKR